MPMDPTDKPNILLVDDRRENLLALEGLLEGPDVNIIKANSGNEALALVLEHDFAVVLMDVQMPDMDGFETAELIRGREQSAAVPIIFVTAISKEEKHVFKGYETGAVDYLFKPLDPDIIKSKVAVFLELFRKRKELEQTGRELRKTVDELKKANRKLVEQQKSVIEEERLKVLLQMAGATAHELNQPLMGLLGNIELIELSQEDPQKLDRHLKGIKNAGMRISDIVRKIQSIRHYETKPYVCESSIMNLDQMVKILCVEESDADYDHLCNILEDKVQLKLNRVSSIARALDVLKKSEYSIVFTEYNLPDGSGLDLLETLSREGIGVPLVVITNKGSEMIASRSIQAGAYDYLPKDRLNDNALTRIISNTLEKASLKRETSEALKKMTEMSIKDELTGLFNRRYFKEAIAREISRATRYNTALSLCMLDLDHFKRVNDTYGHMAGDMVLSKVGDLLTNWVRQSDLVCRYGGEEFAVLLPGTEMETARLVCGRFMDLLGREVFFYGAKQFKVTISIGIARMDINAADRASDMIDRADKALYKAKQNGRNQIVADGDVGN